MHWGKMDLKTLPNGFYLITCPTSKDKEWIFNSGPYMMGGKGFYLKDWTPNFNPKEEVITGTPMWIRMYNLPHEYQNMKTLQQIGNRLGTFVKVDEVIESKDYSMYARLCILWQAEHPLPKIVELRTDEGVWKHSVDVEEHIDMCKV